MIIYNIPGLLVCVAAGVCAFLAFAITRIPALGVLAFGTIGIAGDLYMRLKDDECRWPLVHPHAGGHIWFIPIWILAGGVGFFGTIAALMDV